MRTASAQHRHWQGLASMRLNSGHDEVFSAFESWLNEIVLLVWLGDVILWCHPCEKQNYAWTREFKPCVEPTKSPCIVLWVICRGDSVRFIGRLCAFRTTPPLQGMYDVGLSNTDDRLSSTVQWILFTNPVPQVEIMFCLRSQGLIEGKAYGYRRAGKRSSDFSYTAINLFSGN